MFNNGIGDYFHKAQEVCHQINTVYETKRNESVEYLKSHLSPIHGTIVERTSRSVSDVFIGLCAVSGFLTIPAGLFFAVKKLLPLKAYFDEMMKEDSTKQTVAAKWVEIKNEYKLEFTQKLGPVLFVVLAVDAVFSITIGALILSPMLLLHGAAISAPAAYFIYNTLKGEVAPVQEEAPVQQGGLPEVPQGGLPGLQGERPGDAELAQLNS